jgi:hypothetical protein
MTRARAATGLPKELEMCDGSEMKTQESAADKEQRTTYAEWFCAWDVIEALARDADALQGKCNGNCGIDELRDWRSRIMAQLRSTLEEEERIFGLLIDQAEAQLEPQTTPATGSQ